MGTVKWRVITILVVVLIQMITLQAYFSFRSKSEVSPTSAPVTEIADEVTSTPQQLTVIPDRVDQEPQPPVEIEPIQEPIITVTAPEISAEVELEEPTREEVQVEPVVVASEPVIETPSQEKVVETSEVATKEVAAPVFTSVEDDWADFYIAGEEDYSIFQNDSYYVPLFVNDEYLTDINVTFTDETLFISVLEFRGLISELLTDSFEKEFFGTTKKNFTLDDLNNQGIEAWFDYQTFELRMYFPSWMMPVRLLSINKGNLTRYSAYSMSGSEFINPSWFSWFGNVSMFSLIDMSQANNWKISPVSLFSMQSRNSISLFDIAFDFSYSIHPGQAYNASLTDPWSSDIKDYISFHGIQGFYDFKETSQRLTFGNVNDYLGYSTDSIGIALEKRYNYGDVKPKNHQYEYSVTLEEPSTVEVFINQRSVYRRELQAGVYKLRDFAFTQGANNAQVVVTSLADPTQIQEYDFLLGYDSRLLARGDTLYTLSLSFPDYNIGQTIFRAEQQLGLTDTITSSYNLAFSPSAITLGLSSLFATPWGSIDALLGFSYSNPLALGFSSRLSYRVAGKDESPFGSFDFSVGYTTQEYSTRADISPTATATAGNTVELNTDRKSVV
jgi:outer membrane usher protein